MKLINAEPKTRIFFLDNFRVFLTVLVIFHHAAIAYGGTGDWPIQEPATDAISPIFLVFFNAINQSYFMSAFFLLAGYFTPHSLEKKGGTKFLSDRLVRLGTPILIYTILIINLNSYIVNNFVRGIPYQMRIEYDPGHLWFLQALFLFALVYVLLNKFTKWGAANKDDGLKQDPFPTDKFLFLSVAFLAILTFFVRTKFPVGEWFLWVQPAHFVYYIFSYFAGVLAYRSDWFSRLGKEQAHRWGRIALGMTPLFFVLFIAGGGLESDANLANFLGGFYWQAIAYALWETFLLIGITLYLLYFFRERFNHANEVTKFLAGSAYTVYIIHQTILFVAQTLLLPIEIHTVLKFFISSVVTVVVSLLISIPLRRIPFANKVLG